MYFRDGQAYFDLNVVKKKKNEDRRDISMNMVEFSELCMQSYKIYVSTWK